MRDCRGEPPRNIGGVRARGEIQDGPAGNERFESDALPYRQPYGFGQLELSAL
jgi:hypothetical protein